MSLALRSVVFMRTLGLKTMPKLFSVPRIEEDNGTLSPVDNRDESIEG